MDFVIIGSGVAGITAVKQILKEKNSEDNITVISKEKFPYYYRPRLIETLSGEVDVEDIIIHDQVWFEKKGIDLKLEEIVFKIDPDFKEVKTDKSTYTYDKLLLASGAHSFIPPIKGIKKDNIFTLRNGEDAKIIYNQAVNSDRVVVIGGGLLGLESAYNLYKAGLEVTVVEVVDWLLPRQLDKHCGDMLQKMLENKGLNFRIGIKTEEFTGEEEVTGVKLSSGEIIETDIVLLSTGIKCNTNFLEDLTDLEINKGIIVNKNMETSLKDIYAAGDVANYNDHLYGLWKPSQTQGEVAGNNMMGNRQQFEHNPPSHRLKVVGIEVVSLGDVQVSNVEVTKTETSCQKIFKDDTGKAIGLISVGKFSNTGDIINEIQRK